MYFTCNHCNGGIEIHERDICINRDAIFWCDHCSKTDGHLVKAADVLPNYLPSSKGGVLLGPGPMYWTWEMNIKRIKDIPKKKKQSKILTNIDAEKIVCGALQEKYCLGGLIDQSFFAKRLSVMKGNYALAKRDLSDNYCVNIFDKSDSQRYPIYTGYNALEAAKTYILILGGKQAVKSVSTAVKLYSSMHGA